MVVRNRLLIAGATLLLAGGCFYKFNNPVTAQSNGSIAGQLTLSDEAAGQTLSGATASLQWSGLSVKVDRTNGKFLFVGLPAGTFTLRYDLPAKAGNLFPLIGFRHNLVLPGQPGAADAINLGTVPITPSGRVTGTVSGGDGGPVVLGAFTPLQPDGGGHDFEGYTTQTDSAGAFSLLLPAGNHDLACSTTNAVDAQPVTLQSQQVVMKNLGLAAASPQSSVDGFLVFGDLGANASTDQVDVRLPFVNYTAEAEDGTVVSGALNPASQVPSVGASFEVNLPTGHTYKLTLVLTGQPGSAQDCAYFPPLLIEDLPAVGQVVQLGQVAWLQSGVFISNGGPGACNGGDGGVDAGPSWQLLNAAAPEDAGAVIEVVPLPIGDGLGGTKGHRLAWIQGGQVYSADDVATSGVSYGPATAIWADATNPVSAITGTSTAAGGAAFGWVEANPPQGTVAYYPPGANSETPVITSFALSVTPALVPSSVALIAGADATGTPGLWVLLVEQFSLGGVVEFWFTSDFVNYSRILPIVPPDTDGGPGDAGAIDAGAVDAGGFDGGPATALFRAQFISGTPCSLPELDGGQGVCFAATVNVQPPTGSIVYHWAYDAVLDTQQALPVLSVQLVVDAGMGQSFGIPAITAAPLPGGGGLSSVATGWKIDTVADLEYQVSQFTTLVSTPTWSQLPLPYGTPQDDGILLQWQGAPLEVAEFLNFNPNGIGSVSFGSATPPPFLPGFGVAQLLHGYTAPNGDLFFAAFDHPASQSTTQIGLFVWPPQL